MCEQGFSVRKKKERENTAHFNAHTSSLARSNKCKYFITHQLLLRAIAIIINGMNMEYLFKGIRKQTNKKKKNGSKIECRRPTLAGLLLNEKPTLQYKLPYLPPLFAVVVSDFISFSCRALVPPLPCY